jgi:hypothetical protein
MDKALILREVEKREALKKFIDAYINLHFIGDPKTKLRRGAIQKEIANYIGLTINTTFCQIVNECMNEKGFWPREIEGAYYYRNIRRKA